MTMQPDEDFNAPDQEFIGPRMPAAESFKQRGGDIERLKRIRVAKDDADSKALYALPKPERIRLLAQAGWVPDAAAETADSIENVFNPAPFSPGRAIQVGTTVLSGGLLPQFEAVTETVGVGLLGRGKQVARDPSKFLSLSPETVKEAIRIGDQSPEWQKTLATLGVQAAVPAAGIEKLAGEAIGTVLGAGIRGAGRATGTAIRAVREDIATQGLGYKLYSQINGPPAVSGAAQPQTITPSKLQSDVFHMRSVELNLSGSEQAGNVARRAAGKAGLNIAEDVAQVTPIMNHRVDAVVRVKSEAVQFAQRMGVTARQSFHFDKAGRVTDVAGLVERFKHGATIQDIAARYPIFEPHLTPDQQRFFEELREQMARYSDAWKEVRPDIGQRPDVMDGGFYVPRGRAMEEGVDQPFKIGGFGPFGGKPGAAKTARFDESMEQGIEAGYRYGGIEETLESFVEQAGRDSLNGYTKQALLAAINPATGKAMAETAAERLAAMPVKAKWDKLTSQIQQARRTLAGDRIRAAMKEREATRLARGTGAVEARLTEAEARLAAEPMATPADIRSARRELESIITQGRHMAFEAGENLQSIRQATGPLNAADQAIWKRAQNLDRLLKQAEETLNESPRKPFAATDRRAGAPSPEPEARTLPDAAPDDPRLDVRAYNARINQIHIEMNRLEPEWQRLHERVEGLLKNGDIQRDASQILRDQEVMQRQALRQLQQQDRAIFAAQRELAALERETVRMQRLAEGGERRAVAAGSREQAAMARFDALRTQARDIMGEYRAAQSLAQSTPAGQGVISLPGMQAYSFETAWANAANKIVQREGKPTGQFAPVVNTISNVTNFMRGLRATADLSGLTIQSLLGLSDDPRAWRRGAGVSMRSLVDRNAFGAKLAAFNRERIAAGRLGTSGWANAGLRIGGIENELTFGGKGLGGVWGIRHANRSFAVVTDVLRLEWADDLLADAIRKRGSLDAVLRSGDAQKITQIVNRATGFSSRRAAGDVGELLFFAPRFLQSRMETLATALRPGNEIDQRIARRSIVRLVGGAAAITFIANEAQGKETDWNPIRDGKWNSDFMRIDFGGRKWSLLGPWDSLARMILTAGHGATTLATGGAVGSARWSDLRSLVTSPGAGLAWDFIANETFEGKRVRDDWKTFGLYIAENSLPFAYGNIPEAAGELASGDPGAITGLFGDVFGFKATPLSLRNDLDKLVKTLPPEERTVKGEVVERWSELEDFQRGQLRATPEVEALYDKHEREADPNITEDLRRERETQQTLRDEDLRAGRLTGSEWIDALVEASIGSAAQGDLRERQGQTFPEPKNDAERAQNAYYEISRRFVRPNGTFDAAGYREETERFLVSIPKEQADFIQRNLRASATDTVKDYYRMLDQKREANWYEMYKTYPTFLDPIKDKAGAVRVYEEYLAARGQGAVALSRWEDANPDRGSFIAWMNNRTQTAREFYRSENPDFDRAYVMFYSTGDGITPGMTPQVQAEQLQQARANGLSELRVLRGLEKDGREALANAGIATLEGVANAQPSRLAAMRGISDRAAADLVQQAKAILALEPEKRKAA